MNLNKVIAIFISALLLIGGWFFISNLHAKSNDQGFRIVATQRTDGSVNFQVRTVTTAAQYAPRNIGAIWVTTESGTFVKTIKKWGNSYTQYLTKWRSASSGNTTGATTSATLNTHVLHNVTWNCTNTSNQQVADGNYKVWIEFTERNGSGPYTSVTFTKGASAVHLTPTNLTNFTNQLLDFTPSITIAAPTALTAQVQTDNTVSLSWTAPTSTSGLTAYKVYRNGTLVYTQTTLSATNYVDNPGAGSFTYYVTAMFGTTESGQSNTAAVTVVLNPAPTNVTATVQTGNTVHVGWQIPTGATGLTAFKVYRDGALIHTEGSPTATAYNDTPGVGSFTYHVTAMYGTTESAASNTASVTVNPITAPPTSLTANVSNNIVVDLSWSAPSTVEGLTAYRIYRDATLLYTTGSSIQTTYTDLASQGNHSYYITAMFGSTESAHSNTVNVSIVANNDPSFAAPVTILKGNYPNPFHPATTISFSLAKSQPATLTIYNVRGQYIRTLTNGSLSQGNHQITWDGKDDQGSPVSSGFYYSRLQTGDQILSKKMMLIR